MNIAIIPARGGSKRIPRKNIKDFRGHPVIWYPINVAKEMFDKVVVSTEDAEIKGVAKACGAEVYDRPPYLADDLTPAGQVIADCLEHYPGYNLVACIYPTAVFATKKLINRAFEEMGKADEIFPIIKYGHPIQRALRLHEGYTSMMQPKFTEVRTQDCVPAYFDSGQFYIMRVKEFMKQKTLSMNRAKPIILEESQAQDMDTEEDWKMAELKHLMYKII